MVSKNIFCVMLYVFLLCVFILTPSALAAETIRINVDEVLNDIPNNPVGIVTNHLYDSDIYSSGRSKSLDQSLMDMGIGALRFPEGELGDSYLWSGAPYPTAFAPLTPQLSYAYPNQDPFNDTEHVSSDGTLKKTEDFNEYMSVVQKTGAEPFVIVGIDAILASNDPGASWYKSKEEIKAAAVAWVQYSKNVYGGRVKYWEIGNEPFYPGHTGQTWDPVQYANVFNEFAAAMKSVDPAIKCGVPFYWDNTNWNGIVLPLISSNADFLAPHVYGASDKEQIISTAQGAINTYIKSADRSRMKICLTETSTYNTTGAASNNTGSAIDMAAKIGRELQYRGVSYLHFWVSRNGQTGPNYDERCVLDENGNLLPMGQAIKLWGNFVKEKMVAATGTANVPAYAAYSPETGELSVFLINKGSAILAASLDLQNYSGPYINEKWVLKGTSLTDRNPAFSAAAPVVSLQDISLDPYSATVIHFKPMTRTFVARDQGDFQSNEDENQPGWDGWTTSTGTSYTVGQDNTVPGVNGYDPGYVAKISYTSGTVQEAAVTKNVNIPVVYTTANPNPSIVYACKFSCTRTVSNTICKIFSVKNFTDGLVQAKDGYFYTVSNIKSDASATFLPINKTGTSLPLAWNDNHWYSIKCIYRHNSDKPANQLDTIEVFITNITNGDTGYAQNTFYNNNTNGKAVFDDSAISSVVMKAKNFTGNFSVYYDDIQVYRLVPAEFSVKNHTFKIFSRKITPSELEAGTVTCSVDIANTREGADNKAILVAVLYKTDVKGDRIINIATTPDNQRIPTTDLTPFTLSTDLSVPSANGYYIKLFVWDNLRGMRPLSQTTKLTSP